VRVVIACLLVTSACFPESARHRRYAQIAEGAAVVAGVALNYWAKSNGCMERQPGTLVHECDQTIGQLDTIGLLMIFGGLAGFAGTMISAHASDEPDEPEEGERDATQDTVVADMPVAPTDFT
jgi:hypothetical protein